MGSKMGRKDAKQLELKAKIKILRDQNTELTGQNDSLQLALDSQLKISLYQKNTIFELECNKTKLKYENNHLKKKVKEQEDIIFKLEKTAQVKKKSSQNIVGWTVMKEKDGYYRAKKTIGGKTRSFYIGKRVQRSTKLSLQKKEQEIRAGLK